MVRAAARLQIQVDISLHRPEAAAHAVQLAARFGVLGVADSAAAKTPVDWAGQVDWIMNVPSYPCPWLRLGGVSVMATGKITTCCFDTDESGVVGTVYDDPDQPPQVQPWKLCESCHQLP